MYGAGKDSPGLRCPCSCEGGGVCRRCLVGVEGEEQQQEVLYGGENCWAMHREASNVLRLLARWISDGYESKTETAQNSR